MKYNHKFILASSSESRLSLLNSINFAPNEVISPDIDETPLKKEKPLEYVERVALGKAREVAKDNKGAFILAADTIGYHANKIIGKAHSEEEARKIITSLSGKSHRVYTGVAVIAPDGTERVKRIMSKVKVKRLSQQELEEYIASNEWKGKSGCYSLQGPAAAFIKEIQGSYTSIIGLPLYEAKNMLTGLGLQKV